MRLITLNTWGGRVQGPFIEFIKKYKDTDIFCFQEVCDQSKEILSMDYPDHMYDGFTELKTLLVDHVGFFRPVLRGIYGNAVFVKKNLSLLEEGELIIHSSESEAVTDGHHSRNMQWIRIEYNNATLTVMNVHGLWNGKGKYDSPERISQSNVIREFMDKTDNPKILCGDFNLNPDTESLKILESGMKNLVKDHSISSTRTSFYEKPGKFADYILISPDINEKDFKVLPEEVSDHAALFLEI